MSSIWIIAPGYVYPFPRLMCFLLWMWLCKRVSRVISCLREANSQRPREATVVAVTALDRLRVLTDTVPKYCQAIYWRTVSLKNISRFSLVETKRQCGSEDRLVAHGVNRTFSVVGRRQRFLSGSLLGSHSLSPMKLSAPFLSFEGPSLSLCC